MGNLGGGMDKSQGTTENLVWDQQSPFLQSLFGAGAGLANQFQPNQQIGQQAMGAWQNQLNPQQNPYLQDMTQTFRDNLGQMNQQSGGQAALTGGYGGGRQGVQNYLNQSNQSQQMGQFLGSQYQSDMNRSQQALGQAPMMLNQISDQGQQWGNLGNLQQILGAPVHEQRGQNTSSGWDASLGVGK